MKCAQCGSEDAAAYMRDPLFCRDSDVDKWFCSPCFWGKHNRETQDAIHQKHATVSYYETTIRKLRAQVEDCLEFIDAALADRDYFEAELLRASPSPLPTTHGTTKETEQ